MRMLCGASCLCMTLCILNDMIDVTLTAENLFHPDQVRHLFFSRSLLFVLFSCHRIRWRLFLMPFRAESTSIEKDSAGSIQNINNGSRTWNVRRHVKPAKASHCVCKSSDGILWAENRRCSPNAEQCEAGGGGGGDKRDLKQKNMHGALTHIFSTSIWHGMAKKKAEQSKRESSAARYGGTHTKGPSTFCTF